MQEAGEGNWHSGEVMFESFAMRAVADEREARFGKGFENGLEAVDAFLRGEAADVEQQWAFGMTAAETLSHGLRRAVRTKAIAIDAAGPQLQIADSVLAQLVDHCGRCAEIDGGAVVACANERPDRALEKSKPVVVEIFGKIRVIG